MNSKQRPARQRPKLDRATIVDAAIARIEQYGLAELSARKLAEDLGCEAMSLYHHVGSMEGLKDAVVDRIIGSIAPSSRSGSIEALRHEAESYLTLAKKYPRCFLLVATRRWKGEQALDAAQRVVTRFGELGIQPPEALARARALGAYLNGAGLALAAWVTDPDARAADAKRVEADLRHGLALLLGSLAGPG